MLGAREALTGEGLDNGEEEGEELFSEGDGGSLVGLLPLPPVLSFEEENYPRERGKRRKGNRRTKESEERGEKER